jgi:hypothetical protein
MSAQVIPFSRQKKGGRKRTTGPVAAVLALPESESSEKRRLLLELLHLPSLARSDSNWEEHIDRYPILYERESIDRLRATIEERRAELREALYG